MKTSTKIGLSVLSLFSFNAAAQTEAYVLPQPDYTQSILDQAKAGQRFTYFKLMQNGRKTATRGRLVSHDDNGDDKVSANEVKGIEINQLIDENGDLHTLLLRKANDSTFVIESADLSYRFTASQTRQTKRGEPDIVATGNAKNMFQAFNDMLGKDKSFTPVAAILNGVSLIVTPAHIDQAAIENRKQTFGM